MKSTLAAAALTAAIALSQQQTPSQILDQVSDLLGKLRAAIAATQAADPADGPALAAALANGGQVRLRAGVTYRGNFKITKPTTLTGADPLTSALAPTDGLSPTLTVVSDDVTVQSLSVAGPNPDRETIVVGDNAAASADANPHRVRLVGLTVTAAAAGGHRGIALHGTDLTVDHCIVTGYFEKGRDSQAVWINNGPGPYTVTGSTLEASGENILAGGADPGIQGVVPSNITVTGNTLRKLDAWRGTATVKNSFELKNARHVLFEGNTIEGWWHDGQDAPIQLTARNQGGKCTWCVVDDVTVRGNVVKTDPAGFAVNILGHDDTGPSGQTQTIVVERNLFRNSIRGIQVLNGVAAGLVVRNNTLPSITDKLLSFDKSAGLAKVVTPLTFTGNVGRLGQYGITGDGSTGPGLASLSAYAAVIDWTGNVLEASAARTIPLPASQGALVQPGGLAALLDPTTYKLLSGVAGY